MPSPKCVDCGHAESNHNASNGACRYCDCIQFVEETSGSQLVVLNFSRQAAMEQVRHKVLQEFTAFCQDIGMFRYVEAVENNHGPNGGVSDQLIMVAHFEGHYLPVVMNIYCDNAVDKRVNQMLSAREDEAKANDRLRKFIGEE